jgi:hypothetical protein
MDLGPGRSVGTCEGVVSMVALPPWGGGQYWYKETGRDVNRRWESRRPVTILWPYRSRAVPEKGD